jgi:hypothetical protein
MITKTQAAELLQRHMNDIASFITQHTGLENPVIQQPNIVKLDPCGWYFTLRTEDIKEYCGVFANKWKHIYVGTDLGYILGRNEISFELQWYFICKDGYYRHINIGGAYCVLRESETNK